MTLLEKVICAGIVLLLIAWGITTAHFLIKFW